MKTILILAFTLLTSTAHAREPFDWDRYHAQSDACSEADRIAGACARGHCDEFGLRQARRACSSYSTPGPQGAVNSTTPNTEVVAPQLRAPGGGLICRRFPMPACRTFPTTP
jgi:hypothetical protein